MANHHESLPFDPEDLVRRLDIVLAEQHLQELQSSDKSQNPDSDLFKVGRRLKLRGRKNATAKESQSQLGLEQQQSNGSSSQGELRKSVKWSFRTKRISSARQSDDECASAIPQQTYTAHESTASLPPQAQIQRDFRPKQDGPIHKDHNALDLDWKHIDDIGSERAANGKDNGSSDWTQTGVIDSRSRGLQLLKRISSISTMRAKLGGETSEGEPSRTQIGPIPERGAISHRKSGLLLRLRR